ncbi:MAG: SpoIIE family protein phosphatase [Gammaproteobacteria bacterium]
MAAPKILIVDDEPDVQLLMKQRFRKQIRENQMELFFAQSGVEALKVLDLQPDIRLLISDINMPEMDGLTLLKNLGERHPKVIPIIVSAYGDMGNIRAAMNLGAFDFVTKPINFDDLNATIDKTLTHLGTLIESEQTKDKLDGILHELNVAAEIQQSILPKEFIKNDNIDLYGKMTPAKQIGGDFYDFFWLSKQHLGLVIADVSGKGVPAALFMTVSRTMLRAHAFNKEPPGQTLAEVNIGLQKDNDKMMFVTTFFGILDMSTGKFKFSNGGHNPPIMIRKGGAIEMLPSTRGTALGVAEINQYHEYEIELNEGDSLFLYTDGVTEAENRQGHCFGEKRLQEFSDANRDLSASEYVNTLSSEITKYADGCPQSDDITLLMIRFLKKQS